MSVIKVFQDEGENSITELRLYCNKDLKLYISIEDTSEPNIGQFILLEIEDAQELLKTLKQEVEAMKE